jgi:FKBP-type peptidyl-prolyl cis-trans isomerase
MRLAALLVLLLACTSCKHITLERVPLEVHHLESVTAGGVKWHDLFLGEGPAAQLGDVVVFDYTIWLVDGTRVDSTLDRGVPLESGLGSVPLEGFNQGLIGMRPGGRRRLRIPPELAYGSAGVPELVPPDSALDGEVHLIEVRPAAR